MRAETQGRGGPEPALPSYPFPPKPLRPIPLHIRVKLQDGIHGHDDDDWMIDPDRLAMRADTE